MRNSFSGTTGARRPARLLVLTLLTALIGLAPGTAYADWGRPADTLGQVTADYFSGGPDDFYQAWIRIDGQGDTYVLWSGTSPGDQTETTHLRVRESGGTWGKAETVPIAADPAGIYDAQLSPNGTLTVLWGTYSGSPFSSTLYASTRSPEGTWSRKTLSVGDVADSAAAVDSHNDTVVTWTTDDGVRASYRSATGDWGPVETVRDYAAPAGSGFLNPQVGLDDAGNATAVWSSTTSLADRSCPDACGGFVASRMPGGSWGQPTHLATDSGSGYFSLAVGATGGAAIAWREASMTLPFSVEAVTRPTGSSTWSAPQQLGHTSDLPHTAMGPDGLATVLWSDDNGVYAADHPAEGAWTTEQLDSDPTNVTTALASAPDGTLVAAWNAHGGPHEALRGPGSAWAPMPPTTHVLPHVAVADGGRTVLGALHNTADPVIQNFAVSSFEPGKAAFGSVKAPKAGRVGHQLSYAATVGSWLPGKITWRFGDGHRAHGRNVHHSFRASGTYRVKATITDTSGSKKTITRTTKVAKLRTIRILTLSRHRIHRLGSRQGPTDTRVSVKLSQKARVHLEFRKAGRHQPIATLVKQLHQGRTTFRLTSKVTQHKNLTPGRYRIVAYAHNAHGDSLQVTSRLVVLR